jgi:hypothetical protein
MAKRLGKALKTSYKVFLQAAPPWREPQCFLPKTILYCLSLDGAKAGLRTGHGSAAHGRRSGKRYRKKRPNRSYTEAEKRGNKNSGSPLSRWTVATR